MKRIALIIILIVLVLGGLFYTGSANITNNNAKNDTPTKEADKGSQVKAGLEKGNLAPDFELVTPEGKPVKLSDFKGKKVILNFWATWCPPCRAEIPDIQNFYSKNKDEVVVLGVNLTGSEKDSGNVTRFIKEFGMSFPIVLDKQNRVGALYQVSAIPISYILDTSGIIQQKVVGPMSYEMMRKVLSETH